MSHNKLQSLTPPKATERDVKGEGVDPKPNGDYGILSSVSRISSRKSERLLVLS